MNTFVMGASLLGSYSVHQGCRQLCSARQQLHHIKHIHQMSSVPPTRSRIKLPSRTLAFKYKPCAGPLRFYQTQHGHSCLSQPNHWTVVKHRTHLSLLNRYISNCKAGSESCIHFRETMTVAECMNTVEKLFTENSTPEPQESAMYLTAHVLGHKTLCGVKTGQRLSSQQVRELARLVDLRLTRLPIQYVIGEWDFRSLTLDMKPPVLIPRPETEELVEFITMQGLPDDARFLEVGSGSGAISCSILSEHPKVTCVALDLSLDACKLTERNAKKTGVMDRITIYNIPVNQYGDTLSSDKFDFIVSNPPYIKTEDMNKLEPEISRFEDSLALHGGSDGLDVIKDILQMAPQVLKSGGSVWLEVDSSHPALIRDLVTSHTDYRQLTYIATHTDFQNIPRFCHLKFGPTNMS